MKGTREHSVEAVRPREVLTTLCRAADCPVLWPAPHEQHAVLGGAGEPRDEGWAPSSQLSILFVAQLAGLSQQASPGLVLLCVLLLWSFLLCVHNRDLASPPGLCEGPLSPVS